MSEYDNHVFHYTDAGALLSIVTKRSLWATDTSFLNDRLDGLLVDKVLQNFIDYPDILLEKVTVPTKGLAALQQLVRTSRLAVTTSFSTHYRSLPQFRMYTPSAGGYAIGFPKDYLGRVAQLIQCNYSGIELTQWCRAFAREYFGHVTRLDDGIKTAQQIHTEMLRTTDLFQRRLVASLTFKSDEFINEGEFRLYRFSTTRQFRESRDKNLIIPYDLFELPNEPVKVCVVAGPNREPALATKSVYHYFAAAKAFGTVWEMVHMGAGEFGFWA
jgi:hypothetical protein